MIITKEYSKDFLLDSELKEIALIFADAFSEHENMKKVFTRKRSLYYVFLTFLRVINKKGDIFITYVDEQAIGFLTFMEPVNGEDIRFIDIVKYGLDSALLFFLHSVKDLGRVYKWLNTYSAKEEIEGNNIHLLQAAIKPEFKGKGLMSELFQLAVDYYQSYDAICLETSDPANIGLYEHLGYEIIQRIEDLYIFRKELH